VPEQAARSHLQQLSAGQGLPIDTAAQAVLQSLHHIQDVGYVAQFSREHDGLPVYPSEVRLLLRQDLSLVASSGPLLGHLQAAKADAWNLSHAEALAAALSHAARRPVLASELRQRPGAEHITSFEVAAPSTLVLPHGARVQPIYSRADSVLRRGYRIDFYLGQAQSTDGPALSYIIGADDGRVLQARNLTFDASFSYRVWAENTGDLRPLDGTVADFTPHPTGVPDDTRTAFVPANLVSVEAFNTNPLGSSDPWLANDATDSRGNNVDAYADHSEPDGFSNGDIRATTTGARTFDHAFDPQQDPAANAEQTMAAVTQLFYSINWLHDYWYDSGFDEAAGNAQRNNFSRGGQGGDPLLAEAQDSIFAGSRNNANMSTPRDGLSPRMQVYVWTGRRNASAAVTPGPSPQAVGTASFGPSTFTQTAALVLADDASGTGTDACQGLINSVVGQIVLVDRGSCSFSAKALNVQAAGGLGMLLANNRGGTAPNMGGTPPTPVTIPSLSITQADGAALKAGLLSGALSVTLQRTQEPDLDAAFDSSLVAHEWGHYLHNRLADCGNIQCRGMGEGWGDFLGLHTQMRPGDDLEGTYAGAGFATRGRVDGSYFGTRRYAYSVDPAKNALSLRHISDGEALPAGPTDPSGAPNSEVHNTGEIWASMLYEGYVALLRSTQTSTQGRSFEDVRRSMASYIVASLMITPDNATFIEARDALLAAALAATPADFQILTEAFARRGAGTCAIAPDRDSRDNVGVTEDSSTHPQLVLASVRLSDEDFSCDADGVLDAEERGRVHLLIDNLGHSQAVGGRVVLTSTVPGLNLENAGVLALPPIEPLSRAEFSLSVHADTSLQGPLPLTLGIRVETPDGCQVVSTSTTYVRLDTDEAPGAQVDPVEAGGTVWTTGGTHPTEVWSRVERAPFNSAWHAASFASHSDTWLASPPLQVSANQPFVMHLHHRYDFEAEAEDGTSTNWDGAVIELSVNAGSTWQDVNTWADPGYRGVLTDRSGNPLADRDALVGTSTAWPMFSDVHLDFGTAFAGETVQVRFRVGTDAAATRVGWDLDDLGFEGIDNAPFIQVQPDSTLCPEELTADAGPDQTAEPADAVALDASGSSSFAGRALSFTWTQVEGPQVALQRADRVVAVWAAPALPQTTTYVFEVLVNDGVLQATDRVQVTVAPSPLGPLQAVVGAPQTVDGGSTVLLNGAGSVGPADMVLEWTQEDGPQVDLQTQPGGVATFVAPAVPVQTQLTFQLRARSADRSDTDQTTVTIRAQDALVADAGPDQEVEAGLVVFLDARASRGGADLGFGWRQTEGPEITLSAADAITTGFEAPSLAEATTLSFELTVRDGDREARDTVQIKVQSAAVVSPPLEDGGCRCAAPQDAGGLGLFLALGVAWLVRARRRRTWAVLVLLLAAHVGCKDASDHAKQLNEAFKDPNLKVETYIERFESETRDVWLHRAQIVEALQLNTGDEIADIGAGTGFFSLLFAKKVGPEGRVYALELSDRFIEHIQGQAKVQGLPQLLAKKSGAESVGLAPNSIDVAFICDTYHHFENPQAVMRSVHAALRPGGRVFVIEITREEGKTTDPWVLKHVRAGKATFSKEIQAAGFKAVPSPALPFLKETYAMSFTKI